MKFGSRWAGVRSLYRHIGRNLVACLALLVGLGSASYAASAKISTPAVAPAAGKAQVAANANPRLATFQAEANKARKWLARRFGRLKHPVRVDFLLQDAPDGGGGRASANTRPMSPRRYGLVEDLDGPYAECVIRVTPRDGASRARLGVACSPTRPRTASNSRRLGEGDQNSRGEVASRRVGRVGELRVRQARVVRPEALGPVRVDA